MAKNSLYTNTIKLREARREKNITVAEISRVLGFNSLVSYYNIENGITEPKISQMITISRLLDKPVAYFFNL